MGGVIFFLHGSTHSKGVCILMNPSLNCDFDNLQKDQMIKENNKNFYMI